MSAISNKADDVNAISSSGRAFLSTSGNAVKKRDLPRPGKFYDCKLARIALARKVTRIRRLPQNIEKKVRNILAESLYDKQCSSVRNGVGIQFFVFLSPIFPIVSFQVGGS